MASYAAAAGLAAPSISLLPPSPIPFHACSPSPPPFSRRPLGSRRGGFPSPPPFSRRPLGSRRGGFVPVKPQPVPRPICSPPGSVSDGVGMGEREGSEQLSRATLIWRSIKLPFYSVALVPLTVGSTAAYFQTGLFFARRYLVLLAASILVITWLNLSNDVYDFDTGADRNKKESMVNLVGSRRVLHFAAYALLAFGFMGLMWASAESGDIRTILLLACAILCGYVYQCPPFRLSYQGLGEPLCFMAFGPFATTAFYFSQSNKSSVSGNFHLPLTGAIVSSSLLVGLTTALILFCSHFHQIDGDQAAGKISPLVRIGTETGSEVAKAAVLTVYFLLLAASLGKALPLTCAFLCILTIPVGKFVVDYVKGNHNDKVKMFMAKYYCVRYNALFGAALAAGLVLGRTNMKFSF